MYKPILRRCGIALIIGGAVDIGYMVWCIANRVSYNSSLNIFAVIGGILLVKGNLKASRWVALLVAFILAASLAIVVLIPVMQPIGYFLAAVRNSGLAGAIWLIAFAVLLGLLWWVRGQLYRPEVISAQIESGMKPPKPMLPLAAGAVAAIAMAMFLRLLTHGDTAKEAIRRADMRLGHNYQYVVTNIQIGINGSRKSVSAVVAAYNDDEFKTILIRWQE
jgi:hypothetical protein